MLCLATFETTYMALKFERTCRKSGFNVRIIPVPRKLSSSCGFACSFPCENRDALEELAATAMIDVSEYHTTDDNG